MHSREWSARHDAGTIAHYGRKMPIEEEVCRRQSLGVLDRSPAEIPRAWTTNIGGPACQP
jgi:hypothetical protein